MDKKKRINYKALYNALVDEKNFLQKRFDQLSIDFDDLDNVLAALKTDIIHHEKGFFRVSEIQKVHIDRGVWIYLKNSKQEGSDIMLSSNYEWINLLF